MKVIIITVSFFLMFICSLEDSLLFFLFGTIIIDYFLGIYIAFILNKSNKSEDGKLNSHSGYFGLMKKVGIFIMVWIGAQVDINLNINMCKDMITIGYLINEIISINENLNIIGLEKNLAIKKLISILENYLEEMK